MTAVLTAPAIVDVEELVDMARGHRAGQSADLCRECGWHWPCPTYFEARRELIAVGVDPGRWAA